MQNNNNSEFITYKNVAIHFTNQGNGRPVVLLHGFLENLTIWDEFTKVLAKKYRIISIDLFGHGKTDNLGYVHSMEMQANLVKAVLNHLKLRKVVLMGHSMGGYIVMAFAKLYPKNIKGICLLNSTSMPDSETKKNDRSRAINVVKNNAPLFVKTAIPNLFAESNRTAFTKEIEQVLKEALKTSKQGIIAALEGMKNRENLSYLLDQPDFKKLIFIGENDTAINTQELISELKKHSDTVQKVHLNGGHMGFIENKIEVIKTLFDFFKACFK